MCQRIDLGNGQVAIVCGPRQRAKFCSCGREATLLCDWKVKGKRSGTCDQPVCSQHALQVGPDKHLCQQHQKAYEEWKRRHPESRPQPEQMELPT